MTLETKISALIEREEERIRALTGIIKAHQRKIRYYKDMLKIAGVVEGVEQ